jgi:hypothetical protein
MARCNQSVTEKGSQKWIQKLVNEKPDLLNSHLVEELHLPKIENICWLSPLKNDDYAEYSDQDSLDRLGVNLKKKPLADFWPENGPQWDALGKSNNGKVFLVEAKSHIGELRSFIGAKGNSLNKILQSLSETKAFLNSTIQTDWSRGFYQYANRLAHLHLFRQNDLPAYLVFVYFLSDAEMNGPATVDTWKGAIELLHTYLGIRRNKLQKYIADVFIDINQIPNRKHT